MAEWERAVCSGSQRVMLWVLETFLAPGTVLGRGGGTRTRALGDWGWVLVLVSGYLHTLILGHQLLVYTTQPPRQAPGSVSRSVLALNITSAKMKVGMDERGVVTGTSRGHCGFGS